MYLGPSVRDDVDTAALPRAPVFVGVFDVGREKEGVARAELMALFASGHAERARQEENRLCRPRAVRLASMGPLGLKSKLVDLDAIRSAERRQEPALHPAVGAPKDDRVTGPKQSPLRGLRATKQCLKRHTEPDGDLPEDAERRVRARTFDLRERSATDAARLGELIEREMALGTEALDVVRDAPRQLRRADIVTQPLDRRSLGRRGRADFGSGGGGGARTG